MAAIHERVAGLDVHKTSVVACVGLKSGAKVQRECRSFETTTAGLEALLGWLEEMSCGQVAMEASGVYWRPVWNILSDGDFELVLANAAHIKNVPGRKTDMNDAMWIADLLACGLIRVSFVPEQEMQDLRTLLRTRKQFVREQTRHVQRMQKTLEQGNIKLDGVISDILGTSGRRMIEAMIAGESDPQALAALADRRLKASPTVLREALHGRLNETHRFLLRTHLKQWDELDAAIVEIDRQVDARIAGMEKAARFRMLTALLCKIPGVSKLAAITILAEIGIDPGSSPGQARRFSTAGHLIAWAGLCPGQNQSAGKRKSSRLRKGAPWLKTMLDHAGAVRVGRQAAEGQLLQGAVPPAVRPARAAEGDLCRGRLDPDRDLPHDPARYPASGPRRRLFRPPSERGQSQPPRRAAQQARLSGANPAAARSSLRPRPHPQPVVSCEERSDEAIPIEIASSLRFLAMTRYASSQPESALEIGASREAPFFFLGGACISELCQERRGPARRQPRRPWGGETAWPWDERVRHGARCLLPIFVNPNSCRVAQTGSAREGSEDGTDGSDRRHRCQQGVAGCGALAAAGRDPCRDHRSRIRSAGRLVDRTRGQPCRPGSLRRL